MTRMEEGEFFAIEVFCVLFIVGFLIFICFFMDCRHLGRLGGGWWWRKEIALTT